MKPGVEMKPGSEGFEELAQAKNMRTNSQGKFEEK